MNSLISYDLLLMNYHNVQVNAQKRPECIMRVI